MGIGKGNGPVSREDGTRLDGQGRASRYVGDTILLCSVSLVLDGKSLPMLTKIRSNPSPDFEG